MSFNVNTISAGSTAVISRSAVAEQQLQVSQVMAGKVQENGNKTEDARAVTSTFGTSADKIEISPEGRKALEQIYAQRAAKMAAANANTSAQLAADEPAKVTDEEKQADKAETKTPAVKAVSDEMKPEADKIDPAQEEKADVPAAPMPGSGETTAAEEKSVSSSEIQNMSVSELRTLVTEGTITRAQMDSELSRRKSSEQESEQKAEAAAEAMNEAMNSMKDVNNAAKNMNTFNTTMQYASVAQALTK